MRRKTILPDESLREGLIAASDQVIYSTVTELSGINLNTISSRTRRLDVVKVRHLVSYFLSVNEQRSFSEIGYLFNKDHSTAINSRTAVENWMAGDHAFKLRVIQLAAEIIRRHNRRKIQLIGKVKDVSREHAVAKFQKSKTHLENLGWEVWNPMEHVPTNVSRGEEMRICIQNLVDPRTVAVAIQPDWVSSEGSKVEYMVANALGLKEIRL